MDSLLARDRIRLDTVCLFVLIGVFSIGGCAPNRVSKANAASGMNSVGEQVASTESQEEPVAQFEPLLAPLDTRPAVADSRRPGLRTVDPQLGRLDDLPPAGQPTSPVISPIKPVGAGATVARARERKTVYHANEETFEQHVLRSDTPVLVDFYADWCGPCKALSPTLDELASETHNAKIVKVNIDHSPRLASRYGVRSVPNLVVFKNGRISARQTGAASKVELKEMLDVQDSAPRVSRSPELRAGVDPTRQIASEEESLGRFSQHGQAVGGR